MFFLTDIEFLDVVYQFLLQTVVVVLYVGNRLQTVNDACPDFLYSFFLERFYLSQQRFYVVYLFSKLLLQCGTLLTTEVVELLQRLVDGFESILPLFVAEFLHVDTCCDVGQSEECCPPVVRLGQLFVSHDVLYLLVVILYQRLVDRCGIGSGVLLNPQGEVNFSANYFLSDNLSQLHLFLSVERSNTCGEV